jgi:hypothetical protein
MHWIKNISYLETLKMGTFIVFSIFFATAFCMPVIATTPSIPVPALTGAALLSAAGLAPVGAAAATSFGGATVFFPAAIKTSSSVTRSKLPVPK